MEHDRCLFGYIEMGISQCMLSRKHVTSTGFESSRFTKYVLAAKHKLGAFGGPLLLI
jgi:hypothetical protein